VIRSIENCESINMQTRKSTSSVYTIPEVDVTRTSSCRSIPEDEEDVTTTRSSRRDSITPSISSNIRELAFKNGSNFEDEESPSDSVQNCLREVISSVEWPKKGKCGFLIGRDFPASPAKIDVVWMCHVELKSLKDYKDASSKCLENFTFGSRVVGLVLRPSSKCTQSAIEENPNILEQELEDCPNAWLNALNLSVMIVLCLWPDKETFSSSVFMITQDGISKVTREAEDSSEKEFFTDEFIRYRLIGQIPINVLLTSDGDSELHSELSHEQTRIQQLIQGGDLVFSFCNNSVLLQSGGALVGYEQFVTCETCGDLYTSLSRKTSSDSLGRKAKKNQSILPMSLLLRASSESNYENQFAPIIRHKTGSFNSIRVSLPIDIVIDVENTLSMFGLYNMLNNAVMKQLESLFDCLHTHVTNNSLHSPEVFHFQIPCISLPVTVVYPSGVQEKDLENQRKELHNRLCLPTTKPLFRRAAANIFLSSTTPSGYLLNPHIGVSQHLVKNIKQCLVQGYYSYHHYMQDRFDDDKWGCAYRSLQTLVSWFKYQGYTEKEVPSHQVIQQVLVDINDKPKKFVGSKQWIGSFEVSFVLDNYLGVTSKFINVNAGSELSSVGQQLSHHFLTQGTPIMIGGGVLAHTILGVAYSELTGDICFLILDPHYTGGEDLKTIQDKGWCGWKDMKFWNQTAHYNLCLPQRPDCL